MLHGKSSQKERTKCKIHVLALGSGQTYQQCQSSTMQWMLISQQKNLVDIVEWGLQFFSVLVCK